jgi:hypothetical protein
LELAPSLNFVGVSLSGELSSQPASAVDGDWAWGNRFDIGYMAEGGDGLWVVIRKLDNPNVQLVETNVNRNGEIEADLFGDPVGPTFITLNAFNVYGIEVNRVWRSVTWGNGFVVEPFAGPRYVRIRDHSDRADYFFERPLVPGTGPANGTLTFINDDQFRDQTVTTDNDLFGGQFGLRTQWHRGRWLVSSDLRGFVFHNFRDRDRIISEEINQQTITATYDANGVLQNVALGDVNVSSTKDDLTDESGRFAFGGELRLESMFEITQGFALRGAAEMIVFADGIGRGFTGTSETFALLGFTFGFALNR